MPFAFYADGLVQWLFGIGYLPGRILMILFSVACLVLVYLVGESLGRSRLAGVGAIGFSILVV
jgi:4-amino-4-deoxy-L-arabinose transferase-like glycosyltransferase